MQIVVEQQSPALHSLSWGSSCRLNELVRSVCAWKVENGGEGFNYLELPAALCKHTHPNKFILCAVGAVDLMKTHSLTRPFAHCSRARALCCRRRFIFKTRVGQVIKSSFDCWWNWICRRAPAQALNAQPRREHNPQKFGWDARRRAHFCVGAPPFSCHCEFMIARLL